MFVLLFARHVPLPSPPSLFSLHAELVSASMARSCCKRRVSRECRPWMLKQVQHDQGGGMAPLFHAILTARIYVYTLLRGWCNHRAPEDCEADSAAVRHEWAGLIWSGGTGSRRPCVV